MGCFSHVLKFQFIPIRKETVVNLEYVALPVHSYHWALSVLENISEDTSSVNSTTLSAS